MAHSDYQLRLINKYTGYLDIGSRRFLLNGKNQGHVRFDENEDGMMCLIPGDAGDVHVNRQGRLSVTAITTRTAAPLPISILLLPFEDEQRLIFAGVRK